MAADEVEIFPQQSQDSLHPLLQLAISVVVSRVELSYQKPLELEEEAETGRSLETSLTGHPWEVSDVLLGHTGDVSEAVVGGVPEQLPDQVQQWYRRALLLPAFAHLRCSL